MIPRLHLLIVAGAPRAAEVYLHACREAGLPVGAWCVCSPEGVGERPPVGTCDLALVETGEDVSAARGAVQALHRADPRLPILLLRAAPGEGAEELAAEPGVAACLGAADLSGLAAAVRGALAGRPDGEAGEILPSGRLIDDATERASAEQSLTEAHAHLQAQREELQVANEELEVANEELQVQQAELLRAHAALYRERARYEDLFTSAPVPYLVTDAQGAVREANRAALDLLGYGDVEPASLRLDEHLVMEDLPRFGALCRRLAEGGAPQQEELRLLPQGAEAPRIVVCTASAVREPEVEELRLRWVLRDVTEHRQMMRALAASEQRYRELVRYAPAAIYEIDFRARRFVSVNDAMCHMLGHSRDELLAMDPSSLLDEEGRARFGERVAHWLDGEAPDRDVAYRIKTKDGHTIDVLLSVTFTTDEAGHPLGATVIGHDITERRAAERALAASEARLRLATTAAQVGVFEWDVQSDTAVWENERMYEIFGRSHADGPIGKAEFLGQAIHPDDIAPFERALDEAVATGGLFRPALRIRRRDDGQWRWIEYTARFELAPDGTPARMIGVLADITARVQAERALADSEARLRAVLEALPVGVYIADASGHIHTSNRAGRDLWGEDMPRPSSPDQYHEDYPAWWAATGERIAQDEWALARALARGETSLAEEIEIEAHDGTCKTVLNYALPIRDAEGIITGGVAVNVDITARRRAEEQLRFQAHLLEAVEQAVIVTDIEGRVVYWNPSAERLYGWSADEAHGRSTLDLIASEELLEHGAEIMARLQAGQSSSGEYLARRRDGTLVPIHSATTPFLDPHGEIRRLIGVSHDITERKRTEEALRESELKYATLFDRSPFALAVTRMPEAITVGVNDAFLELFEYTREEVLGKTSVDVGISNPDQRAQVAAELRARGRVRDFECTRRTKSGSERALMLNVDLVDIGGESHVLTTIRDVTELKAAEEALRESEARFATLFHHSPNFAFLSGVDTGEFLEVNAAQCQLTGYSREELIGHTSLDLGIMQPEARQQLVAQMAERGRTVNLETTIRTKAGETRTVIFSMEAVVLGGRRMLVCSGADITARVQAERALAASEARLRAVLEALPVAVWIADPEGTVVQTNKAVDRIWGKRSVPYDLEAYAEFKGWWAESGELLAPEDWALARAALRGEVSNGEIIDVERFDGTHGTILNNAAPVRGSDGRIIGGVAVAQDITERKAYEALLQRRLEDLAALYGASQALAGVYAEADLLQRACELGVERFGLRMAWVGLAANEDDPLAGLVPVAMASVAGDDLQRLRASVVGDLRNRPALRALGTGQAVTVADLATDDLYDPSWREEELARGRRAVAALPLVRGGRVAGVLVAYSAEPHTLGEMRLRTLQSLAHLIAAGLEKARLYAEVQRHAEHLETLVARRTAELRESEARFRVALQGAQIVVAHADRDLRYTWIYNPHPDFRPEDVVGKRDDELVPPEEAWDVADVMALKRRVLESGQGAREELVFHRSDGVHYYDMVADPMRDAEGHVVGVTTAAVDITARRLAQEALRKSEARFRAIYEAAAIGVLLVDREGCIQAANPATEQLLGCAAQDLQGQPFTGWLAPGADTAGFLADYHAFLQRRGEGPQRFEVRFRRRGGQLRWGEATIATVRDPQGAAEFAIAMLEDVTEERGARAALIRAERLQVVSQLSAALAHEIKNPLQGLVGVLSLLEESLPVNEAARRYLDAATNVVWRIDRVVSRLRELHQQRTADERAPTDLRNLVDQTLLLTEGQRVVRGVQTVVEMAEDLPHPVVVEDQIGQVLLNLVVNAYEAMPDGGMLTLRARATADPAGVVLEVADTGVGIAPEALGQVFEFTYTTKEQGTGLGLFITRDMVQSHGGRIDVQSEVGAGATFTVWLPLAKGR